MTEIIFEVTEDEVDGGYSASALGHGIHTQGESVEEIRSNVKEAVDCYFDDTMPRPKLIRSLFGVWATRPCDSEAPTCGSRRRSTVNIMR